LLSMAHSEYLSRALGSSSAIARHVSVGSTKVRAAAGGRGCPGSRVCRVSARCAWQISFASGMTVDDGSTDYAHVVHGILMGRPEASELRACAGADFDASSCGARGQVMGLAVLVPAAVFSARYGKKIEYTWYETEQCWMTLHKLLNVRSCRVHGIAC